jgi:hypothetical protein
MTPAIMRRKERNTLDLEHCIVSVDKEDLALSHDVHHIPASELK